MKHILLALCYCSLLCFCDIVVAQANNCGDTSPEIACSSDVIYCLQESTETPNVTITSSLPNTEYVIVDYAIPATSGTGPSVVGVDVDGVFTPAQFDLTPGESFGIIPISYDLAAIQETLDDILKGSFLIFFPCCDLAASTTGDDVCQILNDAGINCGADVTSLSQASQLFSSFSNTGSDSLSISDFVLQIEDLNITLADPSIPASCGGGDKIAYAYGLECTYSVQIDSVMVDQAHLLNEIVMASDLVSSDMVVTSPLQVSYVSENCINLDPGFQVEHGAIFCAEIDNVCN